MLNTAGLLYVTSRAISAGGNLLAVAIFSHIAGPAEYGHYVLIFAWSMIVYGFGTQWMRFAYFGVYQTQVVYQYVAALAQLLGATLAVLTVVLAGLVWLGLHEAAFAIAVFALVCGMTIYEAAFEVARTLLHAGAASLSMILRTCLTIALGSLSLWLGGGATGLACAIALAHVLAALPCLATFADVRLSQGTRAACLRILRYGWPLLLSFGVNAVGQGIDRLLLAHYAGAAALGPYGVVADVLRQSFAVFGEAIILSLVTTAKQHANEGEMQNANIALQKAFNACLAAAAFGAAFFFVFGDRVLSMLLGEDFIAPTRDLIPILTIAFAFMTMRNFYFAQVIYFTNASHLELVVSALFLVVSTALALVLVPSHGALGAAISLMVACIVSCLAFMVIGRRWFALPIDPVGVGAIPALAGLFVLGAQATAHFLAGGTVPLVIDALAFALFSAFAVHRFGLLSAIAGDSVGVRSA
ncbi:MAG TPA: polysaccharide biosynthesis protein [Xanthobacteraceae bacterium]